MTDKDLTRRAFGGAALLGATAPILVACGGDEPETTSTGNDSSPTAEATPEESQSTEEPGSQAGALVATADVPVGGGVILKDQQVVVTQPTEGEFKCFTAICTHMGCTVGTVDAEKISCPCHGSAFSPEDGSVVNGPAERPLEEIEITVEGDEVLRA